MKVAIYSRVMDENQRQDVQLFFDELKNQKLQPLIFHTYFEQIKNTIALPPDAEVFYSSENLNNEIQAIISLGGDGTLLDTVTLVRSHNLPVMGVNFGRLGFLASIGRDEVKTAIKSLVNHSFVVDKRTLIHLDSNLPLFGDVPYGLNEFAIHKQDIAPMIKIHTYLNGEFLNTYWADGLIVATPTGSTGYSLSCGGPVVFPQTSSFVITPVAPHNLNTRPIVVPDDSVISFEIEGRTEQFLCTMDARTEIIHSHVQLAVKKENFVVSLVRPDEHNFLKTIRQKLYWGIDRRN